MKTIEVTAIILAGGKSSRMGGEDKSLLPINGIPLIQHIVNQLEGHFDEIIIGTNDMKKYSFLNLRVVPDVEKYKGPLMGIYSCLLASKSEVNFVTACDIPKMNIEMINKMVNLSSDVDIVMPVNGGDKYEPLFAVYKKRIIPHIEKIISNSDLRIVELLNYTHYKLLEINDYGWYKNLNAKEDYLRYLLLQG